MDGIKSLQGEKIGLHTLRAAEVAELKSLIEKRRSRAERVLGQAVDVRVPVHLQASPGQGT